jgi:hypothetical protein
VKFSHAANVENVLGLEKLLAHGRKQVGTTGEDARGAGTLARMLVKDCESIG